MQKMFFIIYKKSYILIWFMKYYYLLINLVIL